MTAGNRRAARLEWTGTRLCFDARGTEPVTPAITVDGDGRDGPTPTITLLMAAAACTGADVVEILTKMRVQLRTVTVEVEGTRRDEEPRRYESLRLRYRLAGEGLDAAKAERAVSLSLDKYCSVIHSLAPDIRLEREIELD